jgi:hypothetical protein
VLRQYLTKIGARDLPDVPSGTWAAIATEIVAHALAGQRAADDDERS